MTAWTAEQLAEIGRVDDFRIAPFRDDGVTPGTMIWVWAVVVDGAVHVRSSNPQSRWFAAAMKQRAGRASGGGFAGEVAFELVTDEAARDRVDAAFREKYGKDPYCTEELLLQSRERIARVVPR